MKIPLSAERERPGRRSRAGQKKFSAEEAWEMAEDPAWIAAPRKPLTKSWICSKKDIMRRLLSIRGWRFRVLRTAGAGSPDTRRSGLEVAALHTCYEVATCTPEIMAQLPLAHHLHHSYFGACPRAGKSSTSCPAFSPGKGSAVTIFIAKSITVR